MIWLCIGIVLLLGLSGGRKYRKRAFDGSRLMGDVVAVRTGKYPSRWVRKQAHKKTGRFINKLKGK